MKKGHPDATKAMLEHVASQEVFLDVSIVAGFSFGISKAQIAVIKGKLQGHIVGRFGAAADAEKTQAIREFAPLKEKQHIQQFLGCTNWVRWYLSQVYLDRFNLYSRRGSNIDPLKKFGTGDKVWNGSWSLNSILAYFL